MLQEGEHQLIDWDNPSANNCDFFVFKANIHAQISTRVLCYLNDCGNREQNIKKLDGLLFICLQILSGLLWGIS